MKKKLKFNKIKKFIIFGGGELIIDICDYIIKNKKKLLVLTSKQQIDENIPRIKTSLRKFFIKKKIKFIVLKNLKNHSRWMHFIDNETFGISNSCRWIFKEEEIDLFQGRLFNIHYSNLPSFRGGGGLSWNILSQNFISGTTVHFVNKNIDSGYSVINKKFLFPKNIRNSLFEMQKFSIKYQKKIINDFLKKIFTNKYFEIKKIKNNLHSFYWPRLDTKKNAWIDWSWEARKIINFINAFSYPYEGAATYIDKKIIRIQKAEICKEKIIFHPFQYGLIYRVSKNKAYIAANKGGIVINLKILKFKKTLIGKRLYTPYNKLEKAIQNVKI